MSIEEYLGRNTQAYYDILAEVGQGLWSPENDARPWIRFSLTAHLRQARTTLRRVRESERLWTELEKIADQEGLADRVVAVMFDAAIGLPVRNNTYRAAIADLDEISEATASRDLGSGRCKPAPIPRRKARPVLLAKPTSRCCVAGDSRIKGPDGRSRPVRGYGVTQRDHPPTDGTRTTRGLCDLAPQGQTPKLPV